MLFRRSNYRVRVVTATVVVSMLTALIAVVGPGSTGPAYAVQACPTTGVPGTDLTGWQSVHNARGVNVCRGFASGVANWTVLVQIVDLAANAKVRIISQYAAGQLNPPPAEWKFQKRTVDNWYSWISSNINIPGPGRLFSTVNASHFTDSSSSTTTMLSLPEVTSQSIRTWGYAIYGTDRAWSAYKRKLVIGTPNALPQSVTIGSFPQHYSGSDVSTLGGSYDATVAFEPLVDDCPTCIARRTFVGVRGSTVYVLVTRNSYTPGQAQRILQHFGSLTGIQLDGGGSTAMYSNNINARFGSILNRAVPDVLAVYMAP